MPRQPKILLIEDERVTAEMIHEQISSMGYEVCAIGVSGDEAIELNDAHAPDLIIMDIKLKGSIDGVDAAKKIRQTRNVPIVFLTAFTDGTIFDRTRDADPDGFISKPFTPSDLWHCIEIALFKREMVMKLKESELRYRSLVQDMTQMLCRFDRNFILTFVNDAFRANFGRDRGDLIGTSVLDIIPEQFREETQRALPALQTDDPPITNEQKITMPDGSARWLRTNIRPIFDGAGSITEYQAMGEDVTDFRLLEEHLIGIAENERRRISQELHDDLGQKLSYLGFLAEMLKRSLPARASESREKIDAMITLIRDAVGHVRGIAWSMQPLSMEPGGGNEVGRTPRGGNERSSWGEYSIQI